MKMRTKAETERFYRRLLAEQRRSGLSIRAFAKARGVPAGTLSAWGFQLKKRDAARRAKEAERPTFVPVSVATAGVVASGAGRSGPAGIYEVELGAGRVLRLPPDFDDARATTLVRVVASC